MPNCFARFIAISLILASSACIAGSDRLSYPCQIAKQASSSQESEFRARVTLDAESLHHYDMLELELEYRAESMGSPLEGIATLTFVARETSAEVLFNAVGFTVAGVNENDAAIPFVHSADTVRVFRQVSLGDTVTLWFIVTVPGNWEHGQQGFHYGVTEYTFSEPFGARRWYPCWDQPYDKIDRTTIALDMPESWSLAANGQRTEITLPAQGRRREVYVHESPISTYLVMFAAGEYAERHEFIDGVNYRYFCWPSDSANAASDWARTPQMVAAFGERFGPYPFNEYGMVSAEIMNGWGAMEHQTFTTMGYHLIDGVGTFEGIVAHELGHQWFGDCLTLVDFRNIWLNEGFATYCDALWSETSLSREEFIEKMALFRDAYLDEDDDVRYSIYDPPADHLFGAAIYMKGAWVLHMLREQVLGDTQFFAAMREYVSRFRYCSVDSDDFADVMGEFSSQDIDWFFQQWVYSAGHPELEITVTSGVPTVNDVTVRVQQIQQNASLFRFPIAVETWVGSQMSVDTLWFSDRDQVRVKSYPAAVSTAQLAGYQPLLYEGTGASVPSTKVPTIVSFQLAPAYPNPFNPSTIIPLEIFQSTHVTARLYEIGGRLVSTLVDRDLSAGRHEIPINAVGLSSGVYFVRADAVHHSDIQKIVLQK